jgi:hypothetical protein
VLKLDQMEIVVDPVAEWREMYRKVWRRERDFFYDPNHQGTNLKVAEDTQVKAILRASFRSIMLLSNALGRT